MNKSEAYETVKKIVIRTDPAEAQGFSENYFAEKCGVGRAIIRQILQQLQFEGLIMILPQRGIVIKQLSIEEAWQLCNLRAIVEEFLIKKSVKLLDSIDFAYLDKCIEHQEKLLNEQKFDDFLEADASFHLYIYRHYQNDMMKKIVMNFKDRFYRYRLKRMQIPGRPAEVIQAHKQIVSLLKSNKPDEAIVVLASHVRGLEQYLMHNPKDSLSQVPSTPFETDFP